MSVYIDHIAHRFELYCRKEQELKSQDQEALRKLTQMQLVDNKRKEKKQAVVMESPRDQTPQVQLSHIPCQLYQPPSVTPVQPVPQPVCPPLKEDG